jgi:hypothetical protein
MQQNFSLRLAFIVGLAHIVGSFIPNAFSDFHP